MNRPDWLSLAGWIILAQLAGAVGAAGSRSAGTFYRTLDRPPWAPPPSIFGPVWITLYLMMGIAAWMAWRTPAAAGREGALVLFGVQLVVNALWSWIFFAWRSGRWALIDIVVLVVLIVATIVAFARLKPLAGWLLVPYLAWVTFATALTWSIWRRNPALLG